VHSHTNSEALFILATLNKPVEQVSQLSGVVQFAQPWIKLEHNSQIKFPISTYKFGLHTHVLVREILSGDCTLNYPVTLQLSHIAGPTEHVEHIG
jgi:hypothetical protein